MRKCVTLALLAVVMVAAFVAPVPAAEMRGLWVDAWNPGFRTPEETAAMVAKAKECNFNALFVQVRKRGDTYYKSAIEPMALDVAKDYDPLADVVAKGHAAGMQVHAWIVVYEVYHDVPEAKPQAKQIHVQHPEWLMKDESGYKKFPGDKLLLDPGVPAVQDYLVSIVEEIAKKYGVDGIQLDMVRYPDRTAGYNERSVAEFNKVTGRSGNPKRDDPEWCDWRKTQIATFVRRSQDKLREIKPKAQISAAVFANLKDATDNKLQDWEQWLKDGVLDFACPMLFVDHPGLFQKTLDEDMVLAKHKVPIYIGQAGYKNNAARSIDQMKMIRKSGAKGMMLYNYWFCSKPRPNDTKSIMDTLKEDLFAKPDSVPVIPAAK